ncbi:MAG: patatin-like phospholipase family protein [Gammaproteobacteria bacterium]|nr:patatin-like phospholipase family protein [Gammaproteobacteria bacterium]NIR83957.1 patatin-like phospholipase family protein [Gammaproteobacteria bacterium]NIR89000.1 patatin-like phospholipase family protein [Gammaproteobacteria bacterium]NIV74553.1 patatin-like phospholipase family protein [Gammaproteobacteria bacterium]
MTDSATGTLRALALAAALAVVSACAHYPLNEPSGAIDPGEAYRFDDLARVDNTDRLFVCLAFSGGGTRAAALAYGVLRELRETPVVVDGKRKSLLDEVDCISSVSGGSFTAAYYGLFGEQLFDDFRERFLERDIQGALVRRGLAPSNLLRMASPYFGRIDVAAELYDEQIFGGKRVADLRARGRPFVIMNATDLATGSRFDFTSLHFDAMGSDLARYPVARAVAASSAFPFLLSPITLLNYPTAPGYTPPDWYEGGLDSLHSARYRYRAAQDLAHYLDKANRYVHLMDGGLADNIGARAIVHAFSRGFIRRRINDGEIERLVVILVNARTEPQESLSREARPPSLPAVAHKTATISMDNYSFDSVALMVERLRQRVQAQKDVEACRARIASCPGAPPIFGFGAAVDPFVIEVNFAGAADIEGEDPDYYLNLPTSFRLDLQQVQRLIGIGPKLLRSAPQYRCLLRVLEAEAAGDPRPDQCPVGAGIAGGSESQ